jgi:hypothetical protein
MGASVSNPKMDPTSNDRYPFSVVWCHMPIVSTVSRGSAGHFGISKSDGKIYDFAGAHVVRVDQMKYNAPSRVWKIHSLVLDAHPELSAEDAEAHYDTVIQKVTDLAVKDWTANFTKYNCHQFIVEVLNGANVLNNGAEWTVSSLRTVFGKECAYIDRT